MPAPNPTISAPRVHLHVAASEEWRPVAIDPRYLVSDRGRVLGARGRLLDQHPSKAAGYPTVHITGFRPIYVHRLVALAFLGDPPEGCTDVDHLDCDKTNNDVRNLQWVTHRENILRARSAGRWSENERRGESSPHAKLTDDDVREMRRLRAEGVGQAHLARAYGVTQATVSHIVNRKTWTHLG